MNDDKPDPPPRWPGRRMTEHSGGMFSIEADPDMCNAARSLFGGWMLGILTATGQSVSTKSLREMAVSYAGPIARGAVVEIATEVVSSGRTLMQLRFDVRAGGLLVASAMGVFAASSTGSRLLQQKRMPEVPMPECCQERAFATGRGTGSTRLLRTRVVSETPPGSQAPRALLWVRLDVDVAPEVLMAVVSDHVPSLVRRSMHDLGFIPTITAGPIVHESVDLDWLLLDVRLTSADGALATGIVRIWSPHGRLVATANQTCRLLPRRPPVSS